mmetsp:Transcript_16234/g.29189  ORF Transcript_16234/g.29189 Transcript_16234/m.29189 type:complete len:144 (-) Transcript_16234:46-477(-)
MEAEKNIYNTKQFSQYMEDAKNKLNMMGFWGTGGGDAVPELPEKIPKTIDAQTTSPQGFQAQDAGKDEASNQEASGRVVGAHAKENDENSLLSGWGGGVMQPDNTIASEVQKNNGDSENDEGKEERNKSIFDELEGGQDSDRA